MIENPDPRILPEAAQLYELILDTIQCVNMQLSIRSVYKFVNVIDLLHLQDKKQQSRPIDEICAF